MIQVMSHIKVLLKSTRRSDYFLSQDEECVTAIESTPSGEIMCLVHIADRSDKAPAMKGTDAWTQKYYLDHQYQGNNHVPNIVFIQDVSAKSPDFSAKRKIFRKLIEALWKIRRYIRPRPILS